MDSLAIRQMPCWYFDPEHIARSPSFLDGVSRETEARYRAEGSRFVFKAGNGLNLRFGACATASVFFQRFYMTHSFKSCPRYVVAIACLALAGKVEELPKKIRDLIKMAHSLLKPHEFAQFGQDPRNEVLAYERVLLKTIKFDFIVKHPYEYLLDFVKQIRSNNDTKLNQVIQMSWSFINDSLATTLCLQWEPEIVACAVLYLATRMTKFSIEDWVGRKPGMRWWECFVDGMTTEVLEDICHRILDLYPPGSIKVSSNHPLPSSSSSSNHHSSNHRHHHHGHNNSNHHHVEGRPSKVPRLTPSSSSSSAPAPPVPSSSINVNNPNLPLTSLANPSNPDQQHHSHHHHHSHQ